MVDTLIIGSGVVAAAISQKLLEKDPLASILVLEAGDRIKTKDFALWEQYLITGRLPYEACWDLPYPNRDAAGENAQFGNYACAPIRIGWIASFRLRRVHDALGRLVVSPQA